MGQPNHFSLELPSRCLTLIEHLYDTADELLQPDKPALGSLASTFLLSMSMPIINLPLERIAKYSDPKRDGYNNDRELSPHLAKEIGRVVGLRFRRAPFFISGAWKFMTVGSDRLFNISDGLPYEIASELKSPTAGTIAEGTPVSQVLFCLRNSLAHGGIVYLDSTGHTAYGGKTEAFAFVSGRYEGEKNQTLVEMRILSIGQREFRDFLRRWVNWLVQVGLNDAEAA